jgi:hypothetical protein
MFTFFVERNDAKAIIANSILGINFKGTTRIFAEADPK